MTSPQSTLQIRRTWFPIGYRAEYRLEISPAQPFLPLLADALLREIIEPVVLRRDSMSNLKGRDQRNLIDASPGAQYLPQADEFFYAAGAITRTPKAGEGEEFSLAIESKFLPSGHLEMSHAPEIRRQQFPPELDVRRVGRLIPVHLRHVRLGFDIYQARFLSSLMGLVPTVTQTLLVEANEKRCLLSIDAEALRARSELPLRRELLFERLNRAFGSVFDFDVLEDYRTRLRVQ